MFRYILFVIILFNTLQFGKLNAENSPIVLNNLKKDTNTIKSLIELSKLNNPIDSNINYAYQAYLLAQELKYTYGEALALHNLGEKYYFSADYEKAVFFLHKELKILEDNISISNNIAMAECYRMLGEVSRAFKDFETALKYLEKAENIFIKENDKIGLAKTYNRFAAVILELSNFKKDQRVLDYLQKSNEIAIKINYYDVIANNLNIYGTYYSSIRDFNKAIDIYKSALVYFEDESQFSERANVLRNIANTYRFIKEKDSALVYARKSYYEAKNNQVNIYIFEATRLLFYIFHEDFNNSDSAIAYLNESMEKQVHIYDEEKYRSQLQMQHKYDTQLKDKEIESQKKLILYQIIVFISILIILIVIVSLFYYKSLIQKKPTKPLKNKMRNLQS